MNVVEEEVSDFSVEIQLTSTHVSDNLCCLLICTASSASLHLVSFPHIAGPHPLPFPTC